MRRILLVFAALVLTSSLITCHEVIGEDGEFNDDSMMSISDEFGEGFGDDDAVDGFIHHDYSTENAPITEGDTGASSRPKPSASSPPPPSPPKSIRSIFTKENLWGRWRLEVCCLVTFIGVMSQMFVGKKMNTKVIEAWCESTRDVFQQQFESVGFDKAFIRAYGWDYFEFFASGRINCQYCLARLQCLPRQCIWLKYILSIFRGTRDTMELEIPLHSTDKYSILIGRRVEQKTLQNLHPDLRDSVSVRRSDYLSSSLCLLSDSQEVADRVLTQETCNILNSFPARSFGHIIISDLVPSERYRDTTKDSKIIRFYCNLPEIQRMGSVGPMIQFVLTLVDSLSSMKISDKARQEVKKARGLIEQRHINEMEEEKKEKLAELKAQKKLEDEERMKHLDPAALRKIEEKQQLKLAKSRQPKLKLLKG